MTITVFILILFIGLLLVKFLLFPKFRIKSEPRLRPSERSQKAILAFDRYSVKFLAMLALAVTAFFILATSLQFNFSEPIIHPVAIILFILLLFNGLAYFLRKETTLSDQSKKLPQDDYNSGKKA